MAWLFDQAINSDTAFVTIKSASDYLSETGKARNGDRVKELASRLSRLTGLVIGIERRSSEATQTVMLPMIASSNLPNNLTVQLKAEKNGQKTIPGLETPFGIQLEERFFQDIKKHHVAIPRRLWMQLQGQKGTFCGVSPSNSPLWSAPYSQAQEVFVANTAKPLKGGRHQTNTS